MKKIFISSIIIVLFLCGFLIALAADTGFLSPTINGTQAGGGFTSPNNAHASDDVYATETTAGDAQFYRVFTGLYAAIPAGATINGVRVGVEGYADGTIIVNGDNVTIKLAISKNGGTSWSAEKQVLFMVDEPEGSQIQGTPTDLWGLTLDKESFTDTNFRIYVKASSFIGGATQMNLDHAKVQVYYTAATGVQRQSEWWFSYDDDI